MKIIMANNYLYVRGGAERYMFSLSRELEQHGHEVTFYSMNHSQNISSPYSDYFPHETNFDGQLNIAEKIKLSVNMIYSKEAKTNVLKLLDNVKPDLFAFRNIYHHLSPSILIAAKEKGLPVVMHLADYKIICPGYKLLNKGHICEKCKGNFFYNAFTQACVKESYSKSFLVMIESYIHNLVNIYQDNVDKIICPSQFAKMKLEEFGVAPQKLIHVPHGLDVTGIEPNYSNKGYLLYFGRLSEEKGVLTLVRAIQDLKNIQLVIAGDGPIRKSIEKYIEDNSICNIKVVGYKSGQDLINLIQNSAFIVVPSEWYEVFGLSIYEAFSYGKPVIGANIGAIPELVKHGETGLLFTPGNEEELKECINFLWEESDRITSMGKNARKEIDNSFSATSNYLQVIKTYSDLVENS